MLASNRDRLSNDVSQMLTGPALVAMATKFDTKQAITPLTYGKYRGAAST